MLRFCDGFDHYTTILQKWDSVFNAPVITSAAARTGSGGLKIAASFTQYGVQKNVATTTTGFVGFALNINVAPTGVTQILTFYDGTTVQVDLRVDSTGRLSFTRNGTTLGTATSLISFGAWHYVEVKVTIDPSAGIAEVKVDGVFYLQLSSQNTRASSNSSFGAIQLGTNSLTGNPVTLFYDDLYFLDTTGSLNNTYLGDIQVNAILPNSNGTENDFARGGSSVGSQNYQQVDENPPDGDTSYVYASTIGNIDRYLYPQVVPTTGTPYAVVVWNFARKDDTGTRSIRAAVKSGSTVSDNGTDFPLSVSYQYYMGLFETDPNTSSAWALAAIGSAEFGVKLTA